MRNAGFLISFAGFQTRKSGTPRAGARTGLTLVFPHPGTDSSRLQGSAKLARNLGAARPELTTETAAVHLSAGWDGYCYIRSVCR